MARTRSIVVRSAPRLDYPPFDPPRLLRNAHIQTILGARKPRRWSYGWSAWEPEEIDLGEDGKLLAEVSWQPGRRSDSPAVFLLHGLEGSAQSHYLVGMSKKAFAEGFHTVRVNTRNCGGTEHLTPTLYCAALSQDIPPIVRHLRERHGVTRVFGAGVSLGANILLKFLGEQEESGPDYLDGAAVVSPPIDLAQAARRIERPGNRIYLHYFVRKLKERLRRKAALFPDIADMGRAGRVRTIWEFDDVVTAPHFGFGTAADYYRLASAGSLLTRIRVPTLIVQAQDDPLIPYDPFRSSGIETNPCLHLLTPAHGGHAGFLGLRQADNCDRDGYWAESRVVQFLSALARAA